MKDKGKCAPTPGGAIFWVLDASGDGGYAEKAMPLIIAAIRTGHDPIGKLPEASFHRWLEDQLVCPKCSASYNLVCDYNQSIGRFFEEESRRLIMLLKKAIFLAHANGHKAPHLETNGVVVTSYLPPPPPRLPTIH